GAGGGAVEGGPSSTERHGGSEAEVGVSSGSAPVRRAAARRHRFRAGPSRRDDGGRRVDPGRDRLPQDAARPGPAGAGALAGRRGAAAPGAPPVAQREAPGKKAERLEEPSQTGAVHLSVA